MSANSEWAARTSATQVMQEEPPLAQTDPFAPHGPTTMKKDTGPFPPGGLWEIHSRYTQPVEEKIPLFRSRQGWVAEFEGKRQIIKIDSVSYTLMGCGSEIKSLDGHAIGSMKPISVSNLKNITWIHREVECFLKVQQAVGCGKRITWSEMPEVDAETLSQLGVDVDVLLSLGSIFDAVGHHHRQHLLQTSLITPSPPPEEADSDVDENEYPVEEIIDAANKRPAPSTLPDCKKMKTNPP